MQIEGARADITLGFAVFVAASKPSWFLMENVARARKSNAWARARTLLKRAGCGLTATNIDARQYGVGQARKRVFVIGRVDEADRFFSEAIKGAESKGRATIHRKHACSLCGPSRTGRLRARSMRRARQSFEPWQPGQPATTRGTRTKLPRPGGCRRLPHSRSPGSKAFLRTDRGIRSRRCATGTR